MKTMLCRVVALCLMALGAPLKAEVTATDLQIIGRALGFLERPLSGRVRAGIVYSEHDPRSVRQAADLQGMLGRGLRVGNLDIQPVRVEINETPGANVDLFILADFVGEAAVLMGKVSAQKDIPCVTTDIAQVRNGTCVMGVRSIPKVEILVNRAAAIDSRTTFATVFRMMITEL